MKIKLTKPLVQIGKVVPAGVVLGDCPTPLMEKIVRQGRAVWVDPQAGETSTPPLDTPLPVFKSEAKTSGNDHVDVSDVRKSDVVDTKPRKRKRND